MFCSVSNSNMMIRIICLLCMSAFQPVSLFFDTLNFFRISSSFSLVKDLLGTLLEFTASFVVHLLLFGCSGGAVRLDFPLLLASRRIVSAGRSVSYLLTTVGLLGCATLLKLQYEELSKTIKSYPRFWLATLMAS